MSQTSIEYGGNLPVKFPAYVVIDDFGPYEGTPVVAVFPTFEEAHGFIQRFKSDTRFFVGTAELQRWEAARGEYWDEVDQVWRDVLFNGDDL